MLRRSSIVAVSLCLVVASAPLARTDEKKDDKKDDKKDEKKDENKPKKPFDFPKPFTPGGDKKDPPKDPPKDGDKGEKPTPKEEEDVPIKIPFNPFESPKENDWAVYVYVSAKQGQPVSRETLFYKLKEIEDDTVNCLETRNLFRPGQLPEKANKVSRADAPTIIEYLHLHWSVKVLDVKTTDEKHSVGGKDFACKKLAFTTKTVDQRDTFQLWISKDVKAWGVVEMLAEGEGIENFKNDVRLIGFGNGDGKPDWGKKVEDVDPDKDGK